MFDDTAGTDRLCGFFDFYFAGTDTLLFDVAVCLNDWCTDPASGELDEARAAAFMRGLRARAPARPPARCAPLPALLRAAALRFWISRLWDWHLPRERRAAAAQGPDALRARAAQRASPRPGTRHAEAPA